MYWVTGAALGGLAGDIVPFSMEGLSFAITALFITILIDQVQKEHDHMSTIAGAVASTVALALFGADSFMLPALLMIVATLMLRQKRQERADVADGPEEQGIAFATDEEGAR